MSRSRTTTPGRSVRSVRSPIGWETSEESLLGWKKVKLSLTEQAQGDSVDE